jgi:excisionase family DNA binding protein
MTDNRSDLGEGNLVSVQESGQAGMVAGSRHNEVVKLRNAGLSYAEIGRRLGISRERARQYVKGNPKRQKTALDSKVMLRTSDVAQLLGLHPNTVKRWSKQGILKSYRIGSRGDRRFRRKDIDSFLKKAEIE